LFRAQKKDFAWLAYPVTPIKHVCASIFITYNITKIPIKLKSFC
jgi:hypothetical protein